MRRTACRIAAGMVLWLGACSPDRAPSAPPAQPPRAAPQPATQTATNAATQTAPPVAVGPAAFPPLPAPAREFRGLWVATVANIDWPSKRELTVAQQKAEIEHILDAAAGANFNAILLQVRPSGDAMYASVLEPWSEFLTGTSGKAPVPYYDPLEAWVQGAHARGLELHAWFNPFRARHFESKRPDARLHISNARPDLVRTYGKYLWMDPGEPEAREWALRVIDDVLKRYDVDGVHIDDYFYPYPEKNVPFPDDRSYAKYLGTGGKLARAAWREENINTFVRDLYRRAHGVRPSVLVGISPFGIWRPGFPPGVKGMDAVEVLHADAKKWLAEGWLDYVTPQLYWKRDAKEQPFEPLMRWWVAQNPRQRHVWPGLYTSKIDGTDKGWATAEIVGQVETERAVASEAGLSAGAVQFSAAAIVGNRGGIAEALRRGPYSAPALVPRTSWIVDRAAATPKVSVGGSGSAFELEWDAPGAVRGWVVWVLRGSGWETLQFGGGTRSRRVESTGVRAVAVAAVGPGGALSEPAVVPIAGHHD